jgi:hypothetical protein
MEIIWEGATRAAILSDETMADRNHLFDAARRSKWDSVLAVLQKDPQLINTTRPDDQFFEAPLHLAAKSNAPAGVIRKLIGLGAWRTHRNAHGERPLDIAQKLGHAHLLETLQPFMKRHVPVASLSRIQARFHAVIRGRCESQLNLDGLRFPELEPLMELESEKIWFAVPGMYGGFLYWLEKDGAKAMLMTESWSRMVGGSEQTHEITSRGSKLVKQGFEEWNIQTGPEPD